MIDHSFTKHCSRDLFDVLFALVRHRFPKPEQMEELLKQVDWRQGDLEVWIQNADGRLIDEALTFLFYALSFPQATDEGPHLTGMKKAEAEWIYPVAKRESGSREQVPATTGKDSDITDATAGPTSLEESDTAARRLLSLMRRAKLTLLDAGVLEWEELAQDHRKLEAAYRHLGHGGFSTSVKDESSGSVS